MLRLLLVLVALGAGLACGQAMPPLKGPPGFTFTLFAQGFQKPRLMAVAPNGDVFLTDTRAGLVYALPDRNGDGKADAKLVFARGLDRPHGLAFHAGWLYVANNASVVRFRYANGQTRASGPPQKLVDLPKDGEHETRTLVFGPDGRMYVSVGSSCNVCRERDGRRASVQVYDADGSKGQTYASGLRNAVGLAWRGTTLYASTNGRDYLGDNTPPEAFFRLQAGGFFGWPRCLVTGPNRPQTADPAYRGANCRNAQRPFATVTAHSAPLDLALYSASRFPAAYRGQLIAALHGSSIRATRSGYKLVRIDPASGQVTDFISGFLKGQTVLGRPVGLAVLRDGSLLVSDDLNGMVYRVSYGR